MDVVEQLKAGKVTGQDQLSVMSRSVDGAALEAMAGRCREQTCRKWQLLARGDIYLSQQISRLRHIPGRS